MSGLVARDTCPRSSVDRAPCWSQGTVAGSNPAGGTLSRSSPSLAPLPRFFDRIHFGDDVVRVLISDLAFVALELPKDQSCGAGGCSRYAVDRKRPGGTSFRLEEIDEERQRTWNADTPRSHHVVSEVESGIPEALNSVFQPVPLNEANRKHHARLRLRNRVGRIDELFGRHDGLSSCPDSSASGCK